MEDNCELLLNQINTPQDIKKLSLSQLTKLAQEIREFLIQHISQTGGHLASNLGVVELTIALHYVFDSPKDKIIFDVGHQAYVHKILTGRKDRFDTLRQKDGLSGFTRQYESPHDVLNTGHASNSISFGLGMLMGGKLRAVSQKVVCVIGDGSLTGGLALAALNNAGQLRENLIVIVNDNNMSIGPNVGAMHNYLNRLIITRHYYRVRSLLGRSLSRIPLIGKALIRFCHQLKKIFKQIFFRHTLFSDLGFKYVGPIYGHQLKDLISVLQDIAVLSCPVVVHVVTEKGHGYAPAVANAHLYHNVGPFDRQVGIVAKHTTKKTFTQVASETMLELGDKDDRIVGITAAMPDGTGLTPFAKRYPQRFFDVGIAEEHAVTFAAGLAACGMKPVVMIYSTFMQRATDQIIHDIAMQNNIRVVLLMDRAGFVPGDGENHHGLYDLALFRGIPHLNILAPATGSELHMMMIWALRQKRSSLIRYPKAFILPEERGCESPILLGQGVFVRQHDSAAILFISVGAILPEVLQAADILQEKNDLLSDVYNLRFVAPLPVQELQDIVRHYQSVIVVEEGTQNGGIGEEIAKICLNTRQLPSFHHLGVKDDFFASGTREELLRMAGLYAQNIARVALKIYKDARVRQCANQFAAGKLS